MVALGDHFFLSTPRVFRPFFFGFDSRIWSKTMQHDATTLKTAVQVVPFIFGKSLTWLKSHASQTPKRTLSVCKKGPELPQITTLFARKDSMMAIAMSFKAVDGAGVHLFFRYKYVEYFYHVVDDPWWCIPWKNHHAITMKNHHHESHPPFNIKHQWSQMSLNIALHLGSVSYEPGEGLHNSPIQPLSSHDN